MKKNLITLLVAPVAMLLVYGCGNTAEGVQKDTAENTEKAQETASKAGEAVKEGADKAGEAVKENANKAGEAIKEGANTAGHAAEMGAQNVEAATTLTPSVKRALNANAKLNVPENLINVESTAEMVTLKGHVKTQELKELATQIAQKVLKEEKAKQQFKNELEVRS